MNRYYFKLKLTPTSTAYMEKVMWANSQALAEAEIARIYGSSIECIYFVP